MNLGERIQEMRALDIEIDNLEAEVRALKFRSASFSKAAC